MKNKYALHIICLAACALSLIATDYRSLNWLGVAATVAVGFAAVCIITNIILEARKLK